MAGLGPGVLLVKSHTKFRTNFDPGFLISFENEASPGQTALLVEALDRIVTFDKVLPVRGPKGSSEVERPARDARVFPGHESVLPPELGFGEPVSLGAIRARLFEVLLSACADLVDCRPRHWNRLVQTAFKRLTSVPVHLVLPTFYFGVYPDIGHIIADF